MRLSISQIESIQKVFQDIFKQGEIYLFGSRVDDTKKGGDIDLYIVLKDLDNLAHKKLDFLVYLKRLIGEQKIDVVIDRGEHRLIDKIASRDGILLWKS
ncbi:MAG TPA: nucleotidyltransferase domain-containing protein [Campylobacterales bacterium]|nr:nucleotidyltransferase domain-containing protein [Campylobacterales bacterium]HHD81017.1 nucleotidyltransferase domain-containing protein [Campylobacterales bacterium]